VKNNLLVLNVYEKKTIKSKTVTQLLYGENFKKLKQFGKWIKIKNNSDGYVGYVKNKNFPINNNITHKVCVLFSNLYLKANNKSKTKKKISFSSKIEVTNEKGEFYKFDNFWIKKKDLKKINFEQKNNFNNVSKFLNVRYKWGGKHFSGIDCSGLIQLLLNFNNKFCPRDSKDQIKYFKRKIKLNNIRKNDLIFWKGHVALAISKTKLIHGYGPLKKVVIMPIKKTITIINKTANLKVVGIRRIN